MSSACPAPSQLEAFALGQLLPTEIERLVAHLESCASCASQLAQLDTAADELGHDLHDARSELATSAHAAMVTRPPVAWIQRACQIGKEPTDELPLDVGRRLARQLQEGECFLGRFQLQAELGVGSFGYVFKAIDTQLKRTVALKVQRAGRFATEQEVERFLREAQTVAGLQHPGIVALYDSMQTEDDICYLVSEFVEGQSLDECLKTRSLDWRQSVRWVADIADALHYAHQRGVIHRDVKPSNILIDVADRPHLMDFGLAKLELDGGMTSAGQVLGTPAYMSPEQAAGNSHLVDARSDLFSLGVILYQLLAGKAPFEGNRPQLLNQILEEDPVPPRKLNRSLSRDLDTICLTALAKDPGRRYASADELASDLRAALRNEPIQARRPPWLERAWRWSTRYPLAASLMVAGPFALMAGLVYLTWLSSYLVRQTALESARMEADMLEEINSFYSEEVVGRLDWDRTRVTHQYTQIDQSLPLPFTFMIDAAARITDKKGGMQVRLYSQFPWRRSGGPNDEFELRAIEHLQDALGQLPPDAPAAPSFHEFAEGPQGAVLLYARAQVMQASCVKCHNEHRDSPKRDWQEGDLAGVLALNRPLDRDVRLTRQGLRGASYIVGLTAASLMGFSLLGIWGAQRRRRRPGTPPSGGTVS